MKRNKRGENMTVQELMEKLAEMPSDAPVMLKHDLTDNECFAESVIIDLEHEVVWIREITDF